MNSPDNDRPFPWLPPLSLVVIALIVWLLTFPPAVVSAHAMVPFTITGQALLLFIVLRAFWAWPPMVRWITGMPLVHRIVFLTLIGGMIVGHYTLSTRKYFPFTTWFIFPAVREEDPVNCREFIATTASGQKVRLLIEQLFPSIVQVESLESLDDPHRYPPDMTQRVATVLAHEYNRQNPADPVHTVDLVQMSVQLHPPAGESRAQPSCLLLKRYDISSDQ
jgi:hypothetical protein